jgi:protein-tyrosine phosphatase
MDRENYENLLEISPSGFESRIRLFMEFAPDRPEQEVPDPYFGGAGGFDRVLDMIEDAAQGLLEEIRRTRL